MNTLNRTILELKQRIIYRYINGSLSLNRTILELKRSSRYATRRDFRPLNRTILELKLETLRSLTFCRFVSQSHHIGIETLQARRHRVPGRTLNRTILELKQLRVAMLWEEREPLNRTILELKLTADGAPDYAFRTLNRTILELKPFSPSDEAKPLPLSQSHHIGIETRRQIGHLARLAYSQSHHIGIETLRMPSVDAAQLALNRTILELKHLYCNTHR